MTEPFPPKTKVRVTEQRTLDDAPVGLYTVESYQATPGGWLDDGADSPGHGSNSYPIEGETFTPRYWLNPVPDDGGACTAPADVVVLALEVIRGE